MSGTCDCGKPGDPKCGAKYGPHFAQACMTELKKHYKEPPGSPGDAEFDASDQAEEIARLRAALEEERESRRRAEAMLAIASGSGLPVALDPDPSDPSLLLTRHPLVAGLICELEKMLAAIPEAKNFLTMTVSTKGKPGFALTVQRTDGKSPTEVIGELRLALAAALARIEALEGALRGVQTEPRSIGGCWCPHENNGDFRHVKKCEAARAVLAPPECETCGGTKRCQHSAVCEAHHPGMEAKGIRFRGMCDGTCPACAQVDVRGALESLWGTSPESTRAQAVDACLARLAALPVPADELRDHDRALVKRVVEACILWQCSGCKQALPFDPDPSAVGMHVLSPHQNQHTDCASWELRALAADDAALDALVEEVPHG